MVFRPWELSVDAESHPVVSNVERVVGGVYHANSLWADRPAEDALLFSDAMSRGKYAYTFSDYDKLDTALNEYLSGDFVRSLSPDELISLNQVLNLAEDGADWGYGNSLANDGLFAAEGPAMKLAGDPIDRYVLSGLIGRDLLDRSSTLKKIAEDLHLQPLATAVIMGGLAVATVHNIDSYVDKSAASFTSASLDGISPITRVGATLNGDFLVTRKQKFVGDAIDPTGRPRPFAPAIPEVDVFAYHSTEPEILAALILHKATRSNDDELRAFRDRILNSLKGIHIGNRGDFGDYGQSSGKMRSRILRADLQDYRNGGSFHPIVGSMVVSSDTIAQNIRMEMESLDTGVQFRISDPSNRLQSEASEEGFVLLDDEIEPFILALFKSNAGRTSPDTLVRMLSAIE